MKQIVAVAFVKNNKLLIVQSVRSAKDNLFTLVGGLVEKKESIIEASIRECKEELQENLELIGSDFKEVFVYNEGAHSDPSMDIEIHVLYVSKDINVELIPNLEILEYKWITKNEILDNCSSSIKRFVLWADKNNIM